jgi:hypothetical protein
LVSLVVALLAEGAEIMGLSNRRPAGFWLCSRCLGSLELFREHESPATVAEEKVFNACLGGNATDRNFVGHLETMKQLESGNVC